MKKIKMIITAIFFIFSVYLVVKGQTITNWWGLSMMLIGLSGLLFELYLYNRSFKN